MGVTLNLDFTSIFVHGFAPFISFALCNFLSVMNSLNSFGVKRRMIVFCGDECNFCY